MITLASALQQMETAEQPFQIRFVSFNRSTKKGGEIINLSKAFKVGARYSLKNNDMVNVRQVDNSNHPYPVHIHLLLEFNNNKIFY